MSHRMSARRRHPFDLVARILAERLEGCAPSDELRAMVGAETVDWERLVRYASAQFVLPALAAALRDLDLIGSLDEGLGGFLETVHGANAERNRELGEQLANAVGVLNRAGIEPLLLKGAIRLVDGLYPDQGWRMLRDLDLLVPEARFADAAGVLRAAGYVLAAEGDQGVAGRRPGGLAEIDLHRELFWRLRKAQLLRADEMLGHSRPATFGGLAVRLPSLEHQIVHLVGHSQIKHHGHALGRIAWRDRLEAAALMQWAPERVDWQAVRARFAAAGSRRRLLAFLLSLDDGSLCAVPALGKVDLLTTLQQRRIALQARSAFLTRVGLWAGWSATKLKSQIVERDEGRPRILATLRRLFFERGTGREMVRAFIGGAPQPW